MKFLLRIPVLLSLFAGMVASMPAQTAVPPPVAAYQALSEAQLDQMLGPIALYPDPLIAQILPAATVPTQVVLADRYVLGGGDPSQIEQQPWDASIKAMARYTNVLKWMDDNLTWTTALGAAFLNQQPEVMQSIQRLRGVASKLGNLQSSPQQQVVADSGHIEIVPADPQVIYVPVYQPAQVYYDAPYGAPFITFGFGWPIGPWLSFDCDWAGGGLIFWGRDHPRPSNWWHESSHQRDRGHAAVWRPGNHPGAVAVNRGDRGWSGNSMARSAAPAVSRQEISRLSPQGAAHSVTVSRSGSASFVHPAPISRPAANGAFNAIHSSSAARSYSSRGQQSMRAIGRSSSGGGSHGGGGGKASHSGGGSAGHGGGGKH